MEDSGGAPRNDRALHVRRAGRAYQGAFEALFAILIGGGFGYGVDAKFETSPWGLLVGIFLGFGAFTLRLIRLAREMQAMADAEQAGKAAVTYDGMMIDYAHVRNALELLQQAESFGIEVGEYAQVTAL